MTVTPLNNNILKVKTFLLLQEVLVLGQASVNVCMTLTSELLCFGRDQKKNFLLISFDFDPRLLIVSTTSTTSTREPVLDLLLLSTREYYCDGRTHKEVTF
jgi:hypothetical protein